MANLSDQIEKFIKQLFKEVDENVLEIQRNELAGYFNCAPSQINYVLATRFSVERGYYVESRRGGGGFIRIAKIAVDEDTLVKKILEGIGDSISQSCAQDFIERLSENKVISNSEAVLLKAAVDKSNFNIEVPYRDIIRARLFKNMLSALFHYKSSNRVPQKD
ncbi:MAG: transcriptional regulator of stress and heat shock response [Thermosediminibacterales bacterium]|nr:transcriptional regulator of stress and heat shock response [Thermosediminibacterales bacterium]MDK2836385.1 transcriptional regulator of stress and heat shock response [Thermosediminibacterales bacterium]